MKYYVLKKPVQSKLDNPFNLEFVNSNGYDNYDEANIARIEYQKNDSNNYYTIRKYGSIQIMNILEETMADGPGIRNSVYCAGCKHQCPECHNPETWDENAGVSEHILTILKKLLDNKWCDVTFSGGDPMYQVEMFTELARLIKAYSDKDIWMYTGFTWEYIKGNKNLSKILPYIDTIVDGPFIKSLRDSSLFFRGSSNQRIIDVETGENVNLRYTPK